MNYLFIIILTLSPSLLNAQILRFSDTLNNPFSSSSYCTGTNVTETATGYALTMSGIGSYIEVYYTDSLANFKHTISHTPFGTSVYIESNNSNIQLKNGTWLMPLLLRADTSFSYQQGISVFDKNLTTPLHNYQSQFTYQGAHYSSFFTQVQPSYDSTSFWVSGRARINNHLNGTISHLDSNFNMLSQRLIVTGPSAVLTKSILSLPGNKCLISGIVANAADVNSELDQNFLAKVGDSGIEWYRAWGRTYEQDKGGFLFKGTAPSTYWLVTAENTGSDSLTDYVYKIRASLFTTTGYELLNKAVYKNLLAPYNQVGIQLSDNSIILGYLIYKYNQGG